MTDMDKTNTTNISDYIKAIIGAVIFLTVGILLTSKSLNLPDNTATLILQCFSLGLVLMAVSFKGYYFDKPSNEDELPGKLLLFTVALIPTALIFFVNQSYQELFFFISFFIGICFMLIHGITFKKEKENYLLTFLTSVWVLLGVIVLVKHYTILPDKFFNELSFLHLDTIQTIRIILLIGIGIHIIIISFVEAIKPENKILEAHPIPTMPVPSDIDSYHLLLRPFLWLAYLAALFLNIGIFFANLILAALRIILDSVLRFGWQVLRNIGKLFFGWRSIIFFLILYIVCFSIPFIISVNSSFLLSYIRGDNLGFHALLSQIGILLLVIFLFRLLVTFEFCGIKGGKLFDGLDNLIPFLNGRAYIDNFIPIIYCIVFYAFFISLASIILTALSNWNSFLNIQGYSSIGILTKYCCYTVGIAIIVVIPFIISKSKLSKKVETEEKYYFAFTKLKWVDFWNKSWVLLLFLILCLASYFYINGVPYSWFHDKPETTSSQTIDNARMKFVQDSIELKKKEAKAKQLVDLKEKQDKERQVSIATEKKIADEKKIEEEKKKQIIKPVKPIVKYKPPVIKYQPPVVKHDPYITQTASSSASNSIYISNEGNVTVNFSLGFNGYSYDSYSLQPNHYSYFTFYNYSNHYYDQASGSIKVCTETNDRCVEYSINSSQRYKIEWSNSKNKWDVYHF